MTSFENPSPQLIPDIPSQQPALVDRLVGYGLQALNWESFAWLALLISAIFTRFWNLGARVMSHDESEHVYFSWLLAKGGAYNHNPMMHGPALFELTAFFDTFLPANDFTSRIAPALIGIVIVIVIPRLLRPWLGRWGALITSLFFLVSPYILYFSRYNRHDIYEIAWALLAVFAILSYLRERQAQGGSPVLETAPAEEGEHGENSANGQAVRDVETSQVGRNGRADRWLVFLAGAVGLMFSTMETAFFYLAIFASFLILRLLFVRGFRWAYIRRAAEFDVLVVLASLGAFFSSPIALLVLNPIWKAVSGVEFVPLETLGVFGIEWSQGPYGLRLWGLMVAFWWAASIAGIFWDWRRWWKLALIFLAVTIALFTTIFTNWSGIGTGFVGSLGYWLSQHGVQRGNQPWYFYFIVFPIYEYLPITGGLAALVYFTFRRRSLSEPVRGFFLFAAWWAAVIFTGLTIAGEKMPWLSTHLTTPFILLAGWFAGQVIQRGWGGGGEEYRLFRPAATLAVLPFIALAFLTARTAYLANYVNYDSVVEFIDYAHGGPGVKWLVEDVEKIGTGLGQAETMPVAFDSANAWPLTWYLRNRTGFYGDQPERAALLNSTVVVAGQQNWEKVERYLGANYHRYEVIRIWWPMEGYKNLTWERIRGALVDPEMRRAVWNIIWSRDYRLYAELTGEELDPPWRWSLQDRMRVYIRKDAADQQRELKLKSSQIADIQVRPDPYISKQIALAPLRIIQPGGLLGQRNLALAQDGSVYVADTGNSRIVHLDAQGNVLGSWGSRTPDQQKPPAAGTFNEPWGVAVDAQGNVYVADTWNHRIQKFDGQGRFLLEWGTGGLSTEGKDRFWGPRGIAVGPNGNLYITDTGNRRVVVFDAQGNFLFEFSQDINAQLNEPVGIAIGSNNQVYVADTWNMRVAIFNTQGEYLWSWGVETWNSTSIDEKPFVALDGRGKVYLSDPEAGRVLVFTAEGTPLAAFGQIGSAEGGLDLPTGLASDAQGNIWVADAGNNRLVVYPAQK